MNAPESIEGIIGPLWYHYDIRNDVLYLRKGAPTDAQTYGEETDQGFILIRAAADDTILGMTIVNWWKRFGTGVLPDSFAEITRAVTHTSQSLALAA